MDFNLDTLLNLPNVTVFNYSKELAFIAILNQLQTNRASLIMIKLVLIQPFQQKIYTYITWENQKLDNELPA